MRRFSVVFSVTLLLACASPTAVPLGQTVTLAPGATARIDGYDVEVTFVAVPEDSRCPINDLIQCVWEGDAAVVLRIRGEAGPADLMLHTHDDFGSLGTYGAFRIVLEGLTPLPTAGGPPPTHIYRATLRFDSILD